MRSILLLFLLLVSASAFSQNDLLAKNYFEQGEYEKALTIYNKLIKQNPNRLDYVLYTVEANQQLENFQEAEDLLIARIKGRRILPQLYVELGHNYSLQDRDSLATVNYNKAISFIEEKPNYAYTIGSSFLNYSLLDQAAAVFERASVIDPDQDFSAQLARIYGEQGKLEKMFNKYIELMQKNPAYRGVAQRNFSQYVNEDPTNEANIILRKTLLKNLQVEPNVLYNEILSWLFIQQKDFKKAFTQEKAIYKRKDEDLSGIVDLAVISIAEESYEDARDMVEFIIEKAATREAKLEGHQYMMRISQATATQKDYPKIVSQFEELFEEFGTGSETHILQIDYNHFLAFKNNQKEIAIENLKKLGKKKLTSFQEARVKMELADILVFDEKFNEALIYYSQIQKKVKNNLLAQEARFKVAKTSYFKGDFEWAQVQLDVLKKSASQLIANDAMQLHLMIRDNSLEDSTQTALRKFSRADLLTLQNRDAEAIIVLTDILTNHKGEKIEDEALLKQGEIFEKLNEFTKAEAKYLQIIELYKEDILADDAYYRLAKLYENRLNDSQKAKEFYERLIFDFADSIFFVEARKKFRLLRGDEIN